MGGKILFMCFGGHSSGGRNPVKFLFISVDVPDIFYFFCSGSGEREEASEEVAGVGGFDKK